MYHYFSKFKTLSRGNNSEACHYISICLANLFCSKAKEKLRKDSVLSFIGKISN